MAAWWSAVSVILVGVFLVSVLSMDRPRQSGVRVVDRARLASDIVERKQKLTKNSPECKRRVPAKRCPPKSNPSGKENKSKEKEDKSKEKHDDGKGDNKPTKKPTVRERCRKKWRGDSGCINACVRGGSGKPWCRDVCKSPRHRNKQYCDPKKIKEMDKRESRESNDEDANSNRHSRVHQTPAAPWHSKYTAKTKRLGASGWLKCMQKGRCRTGTDCVSRTKNAKPIEKTNCKYCSWIFHICTETPKHKGQDGQRCHKGRYCAGGLFCDMSKATKGENGRKYGFCTNDHPTDEVPIAEQTLANKQPLPEALKHDKAQSGTHRPPQEYSSNDQTGDHFNEGRRKGSYAGLVPQHDLDDSGDDEDNLLLADGKGTGPQNRRAAQRKEISFFSNGVVAIPDKDLDRLLKDCLQRVGKTNVWRPRTGCHEKIRNAMGRHLPIGQYRRVVIDDVNTWDSNLRMPDGNGEVNDIENFQPGGRIKLAGGLNVFQARLNKPPRKKVHRKKTQDDPEGHYIIELVY